MAISLKDSTASQAQSTRMLHGQRQKNDDSAGIFKWKGTLGLERQTKCTLSPVSDP